MARAAWYRLDNVGKFYSAQAGRSAQTVFRISSEMSEEIDPLILQAALDATLETFPGFNVMLRSGLFWHYLEQSQEPLEVQTEHLPICSPLQTHRLSTLTRVSYYGRRINVEVSHMISDGRGTLELFKMLLGNYVKMRYGIPDAVVSYEGTHEQKTEDSFSQNYERTASGKDSAPKPYRIRGWKDQAAPTFFEYHISSKTMHDLARSMGVSVTSLLITAIICAIRQTMPSSERDHAIRMDVPVDLRRFFGSPTLRNFFGLAYIAYTPGPQDESFAAIAAQVQDELSQATEPDVLKRRMNRMVKLEKDPLLRLAPLFLKDAVLGLAAKLTTREVTTTISSLGIIHLPRSLEPFVRSISVLTSTTGINFVACTFAEDMCIGISSVFEDHNILRSLVAVLGEMGIHGTMSLNKDAFEVDEQLKQAQLERKLTHISRSWLESRRTP